MELNQVLTKVRALIARAEHPETPPAEADTARRMADGLMLKYAVDQAMVRDATPADQRAKPDSIEVELAPFSNDVIGYLAAMLGDVARHCRCIPRNYSRYNSETRTYMSRVYGFEHDLKFFEVLYTTLRLHMLGAIVPQINPRESLDANCYRLHNAGFNWLEIAQLYGWRKITFGIWQLHEDGNISDDLYEKYQDNRAEVWHNKETGEYKTNWQLGGMIKRPYDRERKRLGAAPLKISASGSKNYRKSAAQGYIDQLYRRLREVERERGTGTELVLAGSAMDLEQFFRQDNPTGYSKCPRCEKMSSNPYECEFCGQFIKDPPGECPRCKAAKSGHCRDHPPGSAYRGMAVDQRAYRAGVQHANTADLRPGSKVGGYKEGIER
jgi:Protein of unknown function (DUF2786)